MTARNSLMSILKATKPELSETLRQFCDKTGEMWWYKKSPSHPNVPTLVAHIDTVFDDENPNKYQWDEKANKLVETTDTSTRKRIYFDRNEGVVWSPEGLGADDRSGVFALLYLWDALPDKYKPNLLFTDMEERGAHGARAAAKEILPELLPTFALIEFDRKNNNDAVFYNSEPKEFVDLVTSFGYKKEHGSFSDIAVLGEASETCGVNLSCGYYQQHSKSEYLVIAELFASINRSIPLIRRLVDDKKVWINPREPKKESKPTQNHVSSNWIERYLSAPHSYSGHPAMCCCQACLTQEKYDLDSEERNDNYWSDVPPECSLLQDDYTMSQRALFAAPPPNIEPKRKKEVKHHPGCHCRACNFRSKFDEGAARGKSVSFKKTVAETPGTTDRSMVDRERIVLPTRIPPAQGIDPPQHHDNIKWWNWKKG